MVPGYLLEQAQGRGVAAPPLAPVPTNSPGTSQAQLPTAKVVAPPNAISSLAPLTGLTADPSRQISYSPFARQMWQANRAYGTTSDDARSWMLGGEDGGVGYHLHLPPSALDGDQVWSDTWPVPYVGPLSIDNAGVAGPIETPEMRWLYRKLYRTEPSVRAAINGKADAVACLDVSVIPRDGHEENDCRAAEFVKWTVDNTLLGWDGLIRQIVTPALIDGFSILEKTLKIVEPHWGREWANLRGLLHCRMLDTAWIRLQLDQFRNVLSVVNMVRGLQYYDVDKFILFSYTSLWNNPFGQSDLRACIRSCALIEDAYKLWYLALKMFGMPYLHGKVDVPAQRQMMAQALEDLRAGGFAVTGTQDEIELLNLASASSFNAFESNIRAMREDNFMAIRGAYLPFLEGVGGPDAHGNTAISKVASDTNTYLLAKSVARVLSHQLVPWLVKDNFPPGTGYPTIILGGEDLDETQKTLDITLMVADQFGLPVSKDQVYKRANVAPPDGQDDVVDITQVQAMRQAALAQVQAQAQMQQQQQQMQLQAGAQQQQQQAQQQHELQMQQLQGQQQAQQAGAEEDKASEFELSQPEAFSELARSLLSELAGVRVFADAVPQEFAAKRVTPTYSDLVTHAAAALDNPLDNTAGMSFADHLVEAHPDHPVAMAFQSWVNGGDWKELGPLLKSSTGGYEPRGGYLDSQNQPDRSNDAPDFELRPRRTDTAQPPLPPHSYARRYDEPMWHLRTRAGNTGALHTRRMASRRPVPSTEVANAIYQSRGPAELVKAYLAARHFHPDNPKGQHTDPTKPGRPVFSEEAFFADPVATSYPAMVHHAAAALDNPLDKTAIMSLADHMQEAHPDDPHAQAFVQWAAGQKRWQDVSHLFRPLPIHPTGSTHNHDHAAGGAYLHLTPMQEGGRYRDQDAIDQMGGRISRVAGSPYWEIRRPSQLVRWLPHPSGTGTYRREVVVPKSRMTSLQVANHLLERGGVGTLAMAVIGANHMHPEKQHEGVEVKLSEVVCFSDHDAADFHHNLVHTPADATHAAVYADFLQEQGKDAHAEVVRGHSSHHPHGVERLAYWPAELQGHEPGRFYARPMSVGGRPHVSLYEVSGTPHQESADARHVLHWMLPVADSEAQFTLLSRLRREGARTPPAPPADGLLPVTEDRTQAEPKLTYSEDDAGWFREPGSVAPTKPQKGPVQPKQSAPDANAGITGPDAAPRRKHVGARSEVQDRSGVEPTGVWGKIKGAASKAWGAVKGEFDKFDNEVREAGRVVRNATHPSTPQRKLAPAKETGQVAVDDQGNYTVRHPKLAGDWKPIPTAKVVTPAGRPVAMPPRPPVAEVVPGANTGTDVVQPVKPGKFEVVDPDQPAPAAAQPQQPPPLWTGNPDTSTPAPTPALKPQHQQVLDKHADWIAGKAKQLQAAGVDPQAAHQAIQKAMAQMLAAGTGEAQVTFPGPGGRPVRATLKRKAKPVGKTFSEFAAEAAMFTLDFAEDSIAVQPGIASSHPATGEPAFIHHFGTPTSRMGSVKVVPRDAGKTLHVTWVGRVPGQGAANSLGGAATREVFRQLVGHYPQATHVSGVRVSGFRTDMPEQEVTRPIPGRGGAPAGKGFADWFADAVTFSDAEDEAAFHAHLDANPDDHTTRQVFADWLEERGDPRAEGYRALGLWGRVPLMQPHPERHYYGPGSPDMAFNREHRGAHHLPSDWTERMVRMGGTTLNGHPFEGTRRQVEDRAAHAFAQLPPERRAEILNGNAPTA